MIAQATKDASIQATNVAENADSDLRNLKKAGIGVFKLQFKASEYILSRAQSKLNAVSRLRST